MAAGSESLESWLNKATNPSNKQEDWEHIMGFCDQINKELEGPQLATKLLVNKIHSPQEWEAGQALMVLEACMKNCGQRFQNEVGKFRFLNELIKVISPKYLGDKVSDTVKSKVIGMIYSWTIYLPEETKICEAYQMLKSQGIVLADPEISLDATLVPTLPPERPKNTVFDDEHKAKKLAELLKSRKPADLQEANQLIKNMVKEDEVKTQKISMQKSTLEAVNSSVKLLNEMLTYFSPNDSTNSDKDLIRELHADCDKLRQKVCQLATETDDNDTYLGDILQANDDLYSVMNSCKKILDGQSINGVTTSLSGTSCTAQSESLIDFTDVDVLGFSSQGTKDSASSSLFSNVDHLCESTVALPSTDSSSEVSATFSLLDQELLSLDTPGPSESESILPLSINNNVQPLQNPSQDVELLDRNSTENPTAWEPSSLDQCQQDLALLDLGSPESIPAPQFDNTQAKCGSLCSPANLLHHEEVPVAPSFPTANSQADNPLLHSLCPLLTHTQPSLGVVEEPSLADVFVPLENVKPSKMCPVTAYDRRGVRVLLHIANDCPPGRPDVLVIVASMLNTSTLPVSDIVLQVAVPKDPLCSIHSTSSLAASHGEMEVI
ncbi:ADP-ribosylation factor-binding protein GGA3a isoform X2 [Corythoichthys intestinalis]|uniref:ADP-ribosylation factor-binding protein GGA3a isoform X2 n=1 Tax=Corythoichthys intestinalis TaxID=161448 RepID=UPI0025A4FAE9|nr:ADP-ribosylation factor-binding protein GGA3a isoform X2 [Corythoichthys intestinalis]